MPTKTLTIEGMSCMHCVGAVTRALAAIEGVADVRVDLQNKTAAFTAGSGVTDEMLRRAVEDAGYTVV